MGGVEGGESGKMSARGWRRGGEFWVIGDGRFSEKLPSDGEERSEKEKRAELKNWTEPCTSLRTF